MNKRFDRIFFSVLIVWLAVALFNAIKPRVEFSENENKYLSAFPEISVEKVYSGEFMQGFNTYANEQFVARDAWIAAYSTLEFARFSREINGVFVTSDSLISKIAPPVESYVDTNTEAINALCDTLDARVYVMIVPSASEMTPQKLPAFAETWDQSAELEAIENKLDGAGFIDVSYVLKAHSDEYIFYRTDHHWTTYGATLACDEYRKAAGLSERKYDLMKVSDSFNGTNYSKSGVRFVEPDVIEAQRLPDGVVCTVYTGTNGKAHDGAYFEEYLGKKDKYAYFLGQNEGLVKLTGGKEGGRKLLMFKDSYAHCFAPLLLDEYSEITLADARYLRLKLSEVSDLSEYDDVLFLYSMDGFVSQDSLGKMAYFLSGTAERNEAEK